MIELKLAIGIIVTVGVTIFGIIFIYLALKAGKKIPREQEW